eukprot:COSAG06_NODE_564_length_14246_cov_9.566693_4_plen_216_part_00
MQGQVSPQANPELLPSPADMVYVFTYSTHSIALPSRLLHPFNGCRFTNWEGGTRVRGFVHSPNLLPASSRGTTYDGIISAADIFPTFCTIAGERTNPVDCFPISFRGNIPRCILPRQARDKRNGKLTKSWVCVLFGTDVPVPGRGNAPNEMDGMNVYDALKVTRYSLPLPVLVLTLLLLPNGNGKRNLVLFYFCALFPVKHGGLPRQAWVKQREA